MYCEIFRIGNRCRGVPTWKRIESLGRDESKRGSCNIHKETRDASKIAPLFANLPGRSSFWSGLNSFRLYPASRPRLFREKVTMEMYSRSGRTEKRPLISANVRITSLEHHGLVDLGVTENVSLFGLRAIVGSEWPKYEPVAVESPPGVFRSRAWVVYCQPLRDSEFVVGLQLLTPQPKWAPKGGRAA
jgi:hypothetical protein